MTMAASVKTESLLAACAVDFPKIMDARIAAFEALPHSQASSPSLTVCAAAPMSDVFLAKVPQRCHRGYIPFATRNGLLLRPSPTCRSVRGAGRRSRPVAHPSSGDGRRQPRDSRAHPLPPAVCQNQDVRGVGSVCLRTARQQRSAASIGLRTFGGPSANAGCAVWHFERLARGFTAFFLASPCSPSAAAHPYVGSRRRRAGQKR